MLSVGSYNGEEGAEAEGEGDAQVLGLSSSDGLQSEAVHVRHLHPFSCGC